jgi:hypothetical protein
MTGKRLAVDLTMLREIKNMIGSDLAQRLWSAQRLGDTPQTATGTSVQDGTIPNKRGDDQPPPGDRVETLKISGNHVSLLEQAQRLGRDEGMVGPETQPELCENR